MPIIDWNLESNADLGQVIQAINSLIQYYNSIDNSNIAPAAAIASTKLENGALLTAHASRHAVGGADPLPKSAVSGAMIQPRCINSEHIGLGAILASHLAAGALGGALYFDTTAITLADGEVLNPPEGYEISQTIPVVVGMNIQKSGNYDRHRLPEVWKAVMGEAIICYVWAFDGENDNIKVTGSLDIVRIAFK